MSQMIELPLLQHINETNQSSEFSKKRFQEIQNVLNIVLQNVNQLIEPFTTLKMMESIKEKKIKQLNLGYKIQLVDFTQIIIQSFGLDMIFVIPTSNEKAPYQFGTFKIFYYLIILLTKSDKELTQFITDQELTQFIEDLKKQNQDFSQYSNHLGQDFFENEDQESMKKFIYALKDLFQDKYIQILKDILKILCAIIKLIHINKQDNYEKQNKREDQQQSECNKDQQQSECNKDQKQSECNEDSKSNESKLDQLSVECQNGSLYNESKKDEQQVEDQDIKFSQPFTNIPEEEEEEDDKIDINFQNNSQIDFNNIQANTNSNLNQQEKFQEQLKEIFEHLLDVQINDQNTSKIKDLLINYSGKASNLLLNSNRIIGYAQYLYQKLIQSFFIKVGSSLSKKIKYVQQIDKYGQATFLRFSDQIVGGSKARPYQSNCYLINLQRDLMKCWYEIQKNQIKQNDLNEKIKGQLEVLKKNTLLLQKKNDQQSIKQFFDDVKVKKNLGQNLLVQISQISDDNKNPYTIYEFDYFCKFNHFDLGDDDKKILMTSNLNLFKNFYNRDHNELQQTSSTAIGELLQNFQSLQNNVYNYVIANNSLINVMEAYIQDIKNQEVQQRRNQKIVNKMYSDQNSEGSSSDGVSSCDRKSQNIID